MARKDLFEGSVVSQEGFYIGDICYALSDDVYYDVWGKMNEYQDGQFEEPESKLSFAVGSTAYGDGLFFGSDGFNYGVDAGVIGIVPLELVKKDVT